MDQVEEIKNRIDIVQFIGSYIEVKPAGRNFKARCPFHGEKTPSFMISPERQTWHCFGSCNEGGDVIAFLMKYENIEFYEALKILAEQAGVELKTADTAEQRRQAVLHDIIAAAKDWYKTELQKNPKVVEYIKGRGLKEGTIADFEIGYAPNEYELLTRHLVAKGFKPADIETAGMNFRTDRGTYTDRFRGRIMFPIMNHSGKPIGFSGRIMPEYDNGNTGKYINSPESPIFNKSRVLYGYSRAKAHFRDMHFALVVEGQMDMLMCVQDGLKNAVATSGTALTSDHLRALHKQTENIMFSFDNDEAGMHAVERAIDLAKEFDFNVKILAVEGYKDPAEAVQAEPGVMIRFAKQAKEAMEFYFERYLPETLDRESEMHRFKKGLQTVLLKIKALSTGVERQHWLKQLAPRVNVSEHVLEADMEKLDAQKVREREEEQDERQNIREEKTRIDHIAERLMDMALVQHDLLEWLHEFEKFMPQGYRTLYAAARDRTSTADHAVLDALDERALRASMHLGDMDPVLAQKEFGELLRQLRREAYQEKQTVLARAIRLAERAGDDAKAGEYMRQFDEVSKLIQNDM